MAQTPLYPHHLFSISDVKANEQTQTLLLIFFHAYCSKVRKKEQLFCANNQINR